MALYYCEHCTAFCENKGKKKDRFDCSRFTQRVQTNADRIRSMTDEELASVITDDWCEIVCSGTYLCNGGTCEQHVLKWLKEEIKDGTQV